MLYLCSMKYKDLDNYKNRLLASFTQICDIIICIAAYLAIVKYTDIPWDGELLKTTLFIGVIYAGCVISGGVILYKNNIRDFQVMLLVARNVCTFAILSFILLPLGDFRMLPFWNGIAYLAVVFVISTLFRLALRFTIKQYRKQEGHQRHIVLVGSTENNVNLAREMKSSPYFGFKVCGYFDFEENLKFSKECIYLGKPKDVVGYLKTHDDIDSLYCCLQSRNKEVIMEIIRYCVKNVVHFYSVPNVSNYISHRMHLNMMGRVPYLSLYRDPLTLPENKLVKRVMDIVISFIFVITVFPIILLVVTIITKLTMPGPVFFCQKRNGLNGREFTCLKFRSMKINKEADTKQATEHDPRITKWGNFLRRSNIDETPQFINVLLGSMSIVGPRPHMVKHTEQYSQLIDKYMIRHWVKPGITGWSQVTGFRGETKELYQMEGRIEGDIWYIEHWSPWLDLYIIWKTVVNAIRGDKQAR